ncbi:MAG TPA: ACP phosphodiesterase [Rhodothermales bacterium]|nr:ACP phosphodiesterase [Rhodothermales bacterium]
MNFLAHLFLAENSPESRLGNLLGDFVKGSLASLPFPPDVVKGIAEHRHIDVYTDRHLIVKQSQTLIGSHNRRFAGIAIDVIYDHFLARDWSSFHPIPLQEFTAQCYREVKGQWDLLPPRLRFVLPYMEKDDWLAGYAHRIGIENALTGLGKRMQRQFGVSNQFADTYLDFTTHYGTLEEHFTTFFPQLHAFVATLRKDAVTPIAEVPATVQK